MATERAEVDKKLMGACFLVVEDHDLMAKLIVDLLQRYGHASYARSGSEALSQIDRQSPDIIVLDLELRDMSGLEVARAVRGNSKTRSIPILAMSGAPGEKTNSLKAGCDDFIAKPFEIQSLLNRLAELLPS